MVFFTLTLLLSKELPDVLKHNAAHAFHVGDFVLPLFLFASGMSLATYVRKFESFSFWKKLYDPIKRFLRLMFVSVMLSLFSASVFAGMDEIGLSAVLFLLTILFSRFSDVSITALCLLTIPLYIFAESVNAVPDYTKAYLGGYGATVFYLPLMLMGFVAARSKHHLPFIVGASFSVFLLLVYFIPPYKLSLSPSFMALGISFSGACYLLVKDIRNSFLEYLGKNPLRYWVYMFLIFIVPLKIIAHTSSIPLPLTLGWITTVIVSFLAVFFLYALTRGMDLLLRRKA